MPIKYLEDSPSHYWKSHRAYRNNFYQCSHLCDIGQENFQRKVVEVLQKMDSLKILGIGSGKGELDCVNIRRMLTHFSHIDNTVVEPSIEAIQAYKSLISQRSPEHVTSLWHKETFQQYWRRRQSIGATNKFHFISAVHSLYYADKDGKSLGYLIDLLEKDGVMFIVIQNENSGLINLFSEFAEYFRHHPNNPSKLHTTSKVLKYLNEDGRVAHEVIRGRHQIDITSCFESESSEGSLTLDFLTNVIDFKSTVSSDILQLFLNYMKTPNCSEILSDGRIIFQEKWDAVIVRRK
ncbi:Histamine N-methyltransferase [Holothuria leucospilota]|uniref:Histamine N-methyltransferase n=1 Tax=Holothuria leucospilota TaxID=206669 RepID=A0A9Q1C7M4_HOLLE|nr:Histamine N-methyltransferase [Holothuria leucospilota]